MIKILVTFVILFSIVMIPQSFADYSLCPRDVDRDADGTPDDLTLRSYVDWSNCNLEKKFLSSVDEFDWENSARPVTSVGMPEDAHWNPTSKIDVWIQRIFNLFGLANQSKLDSILMNAS